LRNWTASARCFAETRSEWSRSFTETFRSEICPGNHREVAKKLCSEGILERDKDEWTVKRGKHRFYSISEDILDYGSQEVQNGGQEAQKKVA
jgi:hypothetical protein